MQEEVEDTVGLGANAGGTAGPNPCEDGGINQAAEQDGELLTRDVGAHEPAGSGVGEVDVAEREVA